MTNFSYQTGPYLKSRPTDLLSVLREISGVVREDTLIVSLNGSITFEALEKVSNRKYAKVIPSVTAEINRSQTLVTYNGFVSGDDRKGLSGLLSCIGNVIELPENEMGMGSELVSCMPGFIASYGSYFDPAGAGDQNGSGYPLLYGRAYDSEGDELRRCGKPCSNSWRYHRGGDSCYI